MKGKAEVWRKHPDIEKIEVSSLGRVRTLDKEVLTKSGIRFVKGRILKQQENNCGYLQAQFYINGKQTKRLVHRLVAQTFIPNPYNLPQVNHKDNDRTNNNVSNLEWCSTSYNAKYREKYGLSTTESQGSPLFAINLSTMEVLYFRSQGEAGRVLGVNSHHVNNVIKGRRKTAGGYWFVNADENVVDVAKHKLREIGKTKLASADEAIAAFTSQVLIE